VLQISKIELLIHQSKFEQAEKELKGYLTDSPSNGVAHSLLAIACLGQKKNAEAMSEAQQGVSLDPTSAYAYYVLSRCYINDNNLKKAEEISSQALNIDPEDEDYLCNHAMILNNSGKYNNALDTVNRALEQNPEHSNSKQIKSIILRNIGDYTGADNMASDALHDNPESSMAFAAKGWSLLDNNQNKEALEHFKSAVMLDPNSEYAKSGLVMGIKAQNKLFDLFYRYYLWISKLSPKASWAFVIGIILLARITRSLSESGSEFAPVFTVLFGLYIVFVFLVWTINPIFNIFLRFNRFGKYALDKGEIIGANLMAVLLIVASILFGLHFLFDGVSEAGGIGALFLALPLAGTFVRWDTPKFKTHAIYTAILAVLWIANIILPIAGIDLKALWLAFLVGVVGYTWVSQMGK
jgi:tetratricopeptide (TPR) repeat protein